LKSKYGFTHNVLRVSSFFGVVSRNFFFADLLLYSQLCQSLKLWQSFTLLTLHLLLHWQLT